METAVRAGRRWTERAKDSTKSGMTVRNERGKQRKITQEVGEGTQSFHSFLIVRLQSQER